MDSLLVLFVLFGVPILFFAGLIYLGYRIRAAAIAWGIQKGLERK